MGDEVDVGPGAAGVSEAQNRKVAITSEADVTAESLSAVLGAEIGEIAMTRIGDGLVGMNLRVRLADADPSLPDSVVIKLPSPDPISRATGVQLRNYEREVRFYLDVASTVDVRTPRCHHGEWDPASGDFVLILEDLAPAEPGDQVAGCDVAHAEAAVVELARLHGPRWDDPALHDIEWLGRRTGPDDSLQLKMIWDLSLPGFLATYAGALDTESHELIQRFSDALVDWVEGRDGPLAVTHGDYRLDNLMFRGASPASDRAATAGAANAAAAIEVAAVDWQTPGHHPPVADLSYFCGAGLVPDDRRAHERHLLDRYAAELDRYGVDIDEQWLWEQYRRDAMGGVVMAVVASQIVGRSDRSEAMFTAMAVRHSRHALDLDTLSLI